MKASKRKPRPKLRTPVARIGVNQRSFREVVGLIEKARGEAYRAVNRTIIELYWQVGEYISEKLETAAWGEGVVLQLADYIARHHPEIKGFTRASLFRMRQFFETYRGQKKVAALLRQLPWSHNLMILARCKRREEREFYLRLAARERWGKRELERQLKGALFERAILSPPKVAPVVRQLHPTADSVFKDASRGAAADSPNGARFHSPGRSPGNGVQKMPSLALKGRHHARRTAPSCRHIHESDPKFAIRNPKLPRCHPVGVNGRCLRRKPRAVPWAVEYDPLGVGDGETVVCSSGAHQRRLENAKIHRPMRCHVNGDALNRTNQRRKP